MPQSFDPVFGDWYTKKCIGNGTDGRVYVIEREDENANTERSILKTIRIGENRSESKGFNSINDVSQNGNDYSTDKMIDDITDNIEAIKKADGGKYFVKYEEYEVRPTSDNKGKIILIKLEEMRSLTDLLERFSFTFEETIRLGISVCKALCRCRDFGYIYPNLKPENILFDKNGICKLGDFGTFSSLEPSKTSVAFKRTQYYMAPEFIKTGKINCTADTYSLGLVLYMLTNRGRLPFTEMWPQEVTINGLDRSKENRMNALPLPKPVLASDALFDIISKACAFKESDRYLSPRQMLADLTNLYENKPAAEVQYDDIYSVSNEMREKEEEKLIPEIIGTVSVPTQEEYEEYDEIEPEPVRLRSEISIPDIAPIDYAAGRKSQKKKRPAPYAQLPKISKVNRAKRADIKTLAAIIIAIICIFILLIVSIVLRAAGNDAGTADNSAVQAVIGSAACLLW